MTDRLVILKLIYKSARRVKHILTIPKRPVPATSTCSLFDNRQRPSDSGAAIFLITLDVKINNHCYINTKSKIFLYFRPNNEHQTSRHRIRSNTQHYRSTTSTPRQRSFACFCWYCCWCCCFRVLAAVVVVLWSRHGLLGGAEGLTCGAITTYQVPDNPL